MPIKQYPFYFKVTIILFGFVLFVYSMATLKDILVPFSFALIIAILLNPLVNQFQRKGVGKIFAIIFSMLIALLVFGGIMYFISSQVIGLSENFPVLKAKFFELLKQLQMWVSSNFDISIAKQVDLINEALNSSKALVGQTVGTAVATLMIIFILPVYVFLLLFYKTLLLDFVRTLPRSGTSDVTTVVIIEDLHWVDAASEEFMEALADAVVGTTTLLVLNFRPGFAAPLMQRSHYRQINMPPLLAGQAAILLQDHFGNDPSLATTVDVTVKLASILTVTSVPSALVMWAS